MGQRYLDIGAKWLYIVNEIHRGVPFDASTSLGIES